MPASQTAATERRNERMVSVYILSFPPLSRLSYPQETTDRRRLGGGQTTNALGNDAPFSQWRRGDETWPELFTRVRFEPLCTQRTIEFILLACF